MNIKPKKLLTIALLINSTAMYAGLNDTGITTCSNATQNGLPCPVAGFPGQDAEFGTNAFDFTKIDANGNAMSVTATNHSCVKDNVTGLMWDVKSYASSFDYTSSIVSQVNAEKRCGFNDWRVPDPHELASIVNYSVFRPAIDAGYFPNTRYSDSYWTNSPNVGDTLLSWSVSFSYGGVNDDPRSNSSNFVRCVRTEQVLFSFTDQGNGTVKDNNTGLVWAKCSHGQTFTNGSCSGYATKLTWQQALQAAGSSTLGGYSDWRLPNVKEFLSLVDYTKYNPPINSTYFPNTTAAFGKMFWTSSPMITYPYCDICSWVIYAHDGAVTTLNRSGTDGYSGVSRFVRPGRLLLSLTKTGTGNGIVTSNPTGINCSTDCTENYASGTVITLTAIPETGSVFAGWSYACSGTATTCTVTMDATDKSATATFNLVVTVPTVTTNTATNITPTTATLNGSVISSGATATVGFDFGTTTSYGTNVAATPSTVYSASAVAISANKTDLTCCTTYHYRTNAVNSAGTSYGADKVFTTATCPVTVPIAVTNSATNITATAATLKGTVTPKGTNTAVTFDFGTTTAYGQSIAAVPATIAGTAAATAVSANKTGLVCNTTYNYRVKAVNSAGTAYGANVSFKTAICPGPIVVTKAATGVTATAATLNGTVTPNGAAVTAVTFDFGTTTAYGQSIAAVPGSIAVGAAVTAVRASKTALPCNTTYNYRVKAVNSKGTSYGANMSFKTTACPVSKPDLVIAATTLTPATPTAGNTFSVTLTVKNQGTLAATGNFLEVWINQTTAQTCGAFGDNWVYVNPLAAGASTTITVPDLTADVAGAKTLRAFVDSACEVVEANETNNQMIKTYSVQ